MKKIILLLINMINVRIIHKMNKNIIKNKFSMLKNLNYKISLQLRKNNSL